ncbi:hypothetical protein [Mycoplasma sp. 3341]|uniref:hypothetical protein n=1 Tax=Mycoplasma sp. 3341 TaxID=3447506 RepID=UPI003F65ADB9
MYNKLELLKYFIELCQKYNLWYSLDGLSLVSATTNKDLTTSLDFFEVMMKQDSYDKLKMIAPDNVLDNTNYSEYYDFQNKFVVSKESLYKTNFFIKINIIVPTTVKKAKKFLSFYNLLRKSYQKHANFQDVAIASIWIKKWLLFGAYKGKMLNPLTYWMFGKKITYREAINKLSESKYDGFLVIDDFKTRYKRTWITNLTNKLISVHWNGLDVNVLSEYKEYLENRYGKNLKRLPRKPQPYGYKNIFDLYKIKNTETNTNLKSEESAE